MATERLILEVRTVGTRRVERNFDRMSAASARTAKNVNVLRGAIAQLRTLLVVTASARVLGGLTSVLVDFSDAMGVVRGVTGATAGEFNLLTMSARDLGATTRFTATEVGEGMTSLARAGLNAAEILGTVEQQLLLARVGNLELADAADIATNVLLGFGLQTSDLVDVVDDLAFTANRSNTTVEQLGQAFKFVAPLASAVNLEVGETSAALAVLAQQGIRADVAGTGVARVLARLEAPSTKLQKALGALNIDLDAVRPSAVGFRTALQNLLDSGLSAGAIIELLGDRAGRTAVALLQNLNLFDEFSEGLEENTGFAEETAEAMRSLRDDVLEVVSAFQDIILEAGRLGGEESLRSFLNSLRDSFRFIAANLGNIIDGFKTFIAVLAGAKLIQFAVGLLRVRTAALGATVAIKGLTVALLKNPIILLATGIAIATSALVTFQDQIRISENNTLTLGDALTAASKTLGTTLLDAINSVGGEFESFSDIVDFVVTESAKGFVVLIAIANGVVEGIKAAFDNLPGALILIGQEAINFLIDIFEKGVNELNGLLNGLLKALGSDINIPKLEVGRVDLEEAAKAGEEIGKAFLRGRNEVLRETLAAGVSRRIDANVSPVSLSSLPAAQAPPAGTDLGEIDTEELFGSIDEEDNLDALINRISPLVSGLNEITEAQKTLTSSSEELNKITKEFGITADEVINRAAREVVGLGNAETELAERLRVVDELQKRTALSAEEAALAQRKLRIEAQGTFLSGLNGAFPLLDANQKLAEQQLFLDMNQERLEASGINYAEAQRRLARQSFGLGQTLEQLNEQQQSLIDNQEKLGLSAADLEVELRKLNIAFLSTQRDAGSGASLALERYIDDVTNAASFTEMVFSDAFKGIEDAIVGFVETGKFQIDDLFRNFAAQLIRLGAQQATAGFGSAISGLFGGSAGQTTQAGGGIGGLFASGIGSLLSFQNGGAFTVGANTAVASLPGIDNRLVAFRARDDEEVQITPRGGQVTQAPVNQVFHIQTPDADSFRRTQTQIQNRALAGIDQARRAR